MATTPKTFSWSASLDSFSWTETGSAEGTAAWSSTGGDTGSGDDAGCLKVQTNSGRNNDIGGYFSRTLNFEAMGVPSGATITGITSASIRTYVQTFVTGTGGNTVLGAVTLSDGTTTVTLAAQRTVTTSADGGYQTQSGTNNTSLNWASTQNVTIRINITANGANSSSAQIIDYLDKLTFTITYANYYTLTCNAGSFTLTGKNSELKENRKLEGSVGSFTETGISSTLVHGYLLVCNSGSYSVTGIDSDLTKSTAPKELTCNAGSFSVTGKSIDIGPPPTIIPGVGVVSDYGVIPGAGVYTYPSIEIAAKELTCNAGSYTLTGISAELNRDITLTCNVGTFTLTGVNSDLHKDFYLSCSVGTFTETGIGSDLYKDNTLECNVGIFTLTGINSDLIKDRQLVCNVGNYSLTGISSDLYKGSSLTCSVGTYTFTGIDVDLSKSGQKELICNAGSFTLSGVTQTFLADREITSNAGALSLTGITQTLLFGYELDCNVETYTLTGITQTLLKDSEVTCNVGTYTLTGVDSTLTYTPVAGTSTVLAIIPGVGSIEVEEDTTTIIPGAGAVDLFLDTAVLELICNTGSFVVTGKQAVLNYYTLTCNPGSFTINSPLAEFTWYRGPIVLDASSNTPINGGGWVNPANAYASDDSWATGSPSKNNEISSYFGFAAISSDNLPDNAIIDWIAISWEYHVSTQSSIATLYSQIFKNTTGVGSEVYNSSEPLSDATGAVMLWGAANVAAAGITVADFRTPGVIQGRIRGRRGNSNTAVTFYLDHIYLTVSWHEPFTLGCNAGVFTVNGQNANLIPPLNKYLLALPASYSISGISVDLNYNYNPEDINTVIIPGAGSVSFKDSEIIPGAGIVYGTLDEVANTIICNNGIFSVSGKSAELTSTGKNHYSLECLAGTYNVFGQEIIIKAYDVRVFWFEFRAPLYAISHEYNSNAAFVVTGIDATLTKNNPLIQLNRGQFFVSVNTATFTRARTLTCNAGSFTLTGIDSDITRIGSKKLECFFGYYTITRISADLDVAYTLECNSGSFDVSGINANFDNNKKLIAYNNNYSIIGVSSELDLSKTLIANSRNLYAFGESAVLAKGRTLTCEAGSYSINVGSSSLEWGRVGHFELNALNGALFIVQGSVVLFGTNFLSCITGIFTVTGKTATLYKSKEFVCETGNYIFTGIDAIFYKNYVLTSISYHFNINAPETILRKGGWESAVEPLETWTEKSEPSDIWVEKEEPSDIWYNIN